ncbi:MAG: helix-turn-helix domain-containing protein [Bacteroidales bacterium]|nr:helix-turn-helix domain-containing protein [Bacteroidales bacterium]
MANTNMIVEECSVRLKRAMAFRNMNATELVKKTGISKGSISQYMSGFVKPKQDRLYLIAKALEVDPVWLIGYDVPMVSSNQIQKEIDEQLAELSDRQLALLLAFVKSMKEEKNN